MQIFFYCIHFPRSCSGEITLSNGPGSKTHWMQMLKMMPLDSQVRAGDTFQLQITHTGEQ